MPQDSAKLDLSEKGKGPDGQPISLDRRLFMQFLAFGDCRQMGSLMDALAQSTLEAVLYADINDPQGVGLLTFHENPDYFVTVLREFLNQPPFSELTPKPEYTMFGRTYALGYEPDLEETLIDRPFETLPEKEQQIVLREHGGIGFTFGRAGYATDIRLACHGLDKQDNDFVIGVLSHELYPASAVIQAMRKTKQTSQYLESLGSFFIGKSVWQSKP